MIDSLIAIYAFLTDLPLLISIVAAMALPAFGSKAFDVAEKYRAPRFLSWIAGLGTGAAALMAYALIWRMTGLPEWMGWFL